MPPSVKNKKPSRNIVSIRYMYIHNWHKLGTKWFPKLLIDFNWCWFYGWTSGCKRENETIEVGMSWPNNGQIIGVKNGPSNDWVKIPTREHWFHPLLSARFFSRSYISFKLPPSAIYTRRVARQYGIYWLKKDLFTVHGIFYIFFGIKLFCLSS